MNKPKPNFNFALIARNEAKTLPRLVASLVEFQKRGGEILVLDTGSRDNTVEVAQKLGCRVYEVGEKFVVNLTEEMVKEINERFMVGNDGEIVKVGDRIFDFASARNYIADLSPCDMIATPDCDEIWTALDLDRIQQEIENGIQQFEYEFVFAHDVDGRPLIKFKHSKFYNRKVMKWRGVIHEVLAGDATRMYLDESVAKLEHYQNVETNRNGYLTGLAYDCFLDPSNDRNSHYLARELMYKGKFESAIREFKRHITLNGWTTERSQSMIYIGECLMALGRTEEALSWYVQAFDLEPNRREPLMKIADYHYRKGQPMQVIAYVTGALEISGGNFYSNYEPYYSNYPHELLYWAFWQVGNVEKSREHFFKAFHLMPSNPKYVNDLKFYRSEVPAGFGAGWETGPVEEYKNAGNSADMPTVDFLIPQLGREEGLKKCTDSIEMLDYNQDKLFVTILPGEGTVPVKVAQMLSVTKSDWVVFAANDIEFTPSSLKVAMEDCLLNNRPFAAFNTGEVSHDEGNICEHFMIRRDFVDKVGGEIFDTEFHHVGVDNLLWAKLKRLGAEYRNDGAVVIHNHFSKTADKAMDEVYAKGWAKVEQDRALLRRKLAELGE